MAISKDLPEVAYHYEESVGLVAIKRGREGYNSLAREYPNATDVTAAIMNRRLGVTDAQRRAMVAGSMFGWHIPAADPKTYKSRTATIA